MIERRAEGKIVLWREIGLEHQLRVNVLFVDVVCLLSVIGIHHVHRSRRHPCDIGAVVLVKDEGVLHVSLVALGVDVDAVQRLLLSVERSFVACLSALTFLVEKSQASVEDIVPGLSVPSVLEVELPCLRVIDEAILVGVVLLEVVLVVSENLRAESFREMHVGIGVGLYAAHGIAIEVYVHSLVVLRLQVLYVYLSGHSLVAVLYAGIALAHLNALQPCAGDVSERVGYGRTPEVRHVLSEHLHVLAA